jgi:hypothetical protein
MTPTKNLSIIDLRTVEYTIVDYLSKNKITSVAEIEALTSMSIFLLVSGAWLSELDSSKTDLLFVDDTKPYWRHWELGKIGVNYKGNRKKDGNRLTLLSMVHTQVQFVLASRGFNICTLFDVINGDIYGYEADDIAANTVRKYRHLYKTIYLLTVDTDWLPLTQFENVVWLCVNDYGQRYRNKAYATHWFQTAKACNSTIAQRNYKKTCISQLWDFKSEFGDTSDNLRGNLKDQSPKRYNKFVDLLNPPEKYLLVDNAKFGDTVGLCLIPDLKPTPIKRWLELTRNSTQVLVPFTKEHLKPAKVFSVA